MSFTALDKAILTFLYTASCIAGLLGNMAILVSISSRRNLRKKQCNMFIVGLAATDLMTCVFCGPYYIRSLHITSFFQNKDFGQIFCVVILAVAYSLAINSILSLTLLSVDRYGAIKFPFWYNKKVTKNRCLAAVCFAWIYSILVVLPPAFLQGWVEYENEPGSPCGFQWKNASSWYLGFMVIVNVAAPATVVSLTNIVVFKTARSQNIKTAPTSIRVDNAAIKTVKLVPTATNAAKSEETCKLKRSLPAIKATQLQRRCNRERRDANCKSRDYDALRASKRKRLFSSFSSQRLSSDATCNQKCKCLFTTNHSSLSSISGAVTAPTSKAFFTRSPGLRKHPSKPGATNESAFHAPKQKRLNMTSITEQLSGKEFQSGQQLEEVDTQIDNCENQQATFRSKISDEKKRVKQSTKDRFTASPLGRAKCGLLASSSFTKHDEISAEMHCGKKPASLDPNDICRVSNGNLNTIKPSLPCRFRSSRRFSSPCNIERHRSPSLEHLTALKINARRKNKLSRKTTSKSETKLALATISLAISFFLSWIPFVAVRILKSSLSLAITERAVNYSSAFAFMNAAWNPYVILLTRKQIYNGAKLVAGKVSRILLCKK